MARLAESSLAFRVIPHLTNIRPIEIVHFSIRDDVIAVQPIYGDRRA